MNISVGENCRNFELVPKFCPIRYMDKSFVYAGGRWNFIRRRSSENGDSRMQRRSRYSWQTFFRCTTCRNYKVRHGLLYLQDWTLIWSRVDFYNWPLFLTSGDLASANHLTPVTLLSTIFLQYNHMGVHGWVLRLLSLKDYRFKKRSKVIEI